MVDAIAIFLPLIGSIVAGLCALASNSSNKNQQRKIEIASQLITCGALLVSMALAWFIFFSITKEGVLRVTEISNWISSGSFEVSWALRVDSLTAVMMVLVTTVSAMVHIYSIGYMQNDPSIPRFMCYLSLFTFFMLVLVSADNLIQLFFGWEGVGLASYLLIGFWYYKPSANAAAIKAFIVNRVGDFGFALGIFSIFVVFDTVHFNTIFQAVPAKNTYMIEIFGGEFHALTVICLLLFVGAMGKSAQLGLHTWLPDAMEGPTPVSALIHAATMVTAGIFMVARLSPIFEFSETALAVVTIVGATTTIFAATVACTQFDLKRVVAYSTCSQLGYMFFACGVSAYSAGIFHLLTHGFFKAVLFLGAGSVIHAMSDEQDIRKMGGIWKLIPITYVLMWIGSLALAGLPPFAGYFSKDIVLESAWAANTSFGYYAFWMGILAAMLTAFYSWRLIFITFHGKSRADEKVVAHIHESPPTMIGPIIILAVGAIFSGYLFYSNFVGHDAINFWGQSITILDTHQAINKAHLVPSWVKNLPLNVAILGIFIAYLMYIWRPKLPTILAEKFRWLHLFFYNKWYWDELYTLLFVRPATRLGWNLWKIGDGLLIDGIGPDGISSAVKRIAKRVAAFQTGYLYHYAFAMLAGLVVLISSYIFVRGG